MKEEGYIVNFDNITKGVLSNLIEFDRFFFSTFSISSSTFSYNEFTNIGDDKGLLFQIGSEDTISYLSQNYTSVSLSTVTISYNFVVNSQALFYTFVNTFT